MREDYVRNLEEERDALEARLRRLEREIEELRRASPKP
jgi:chaperonin cofactor prefoldin